MPALPPESGAGCANASPAHLSSVPDRELTPDCREGLSVGIGRRKSSCAGEHPRDVLFRLLAGIDEQHAGG